MCKLWKSGVQTMHALQTVYGDNTLKKSAVYDWQNSSKMGKNSSTIKKEETTMQETFNFREC